MGEMDSENSYSRTLSFAAIEIEVLKEPFFGEQQPESERRQTLEYGGFMKATIKITPVF